MDTAKIVAFNNIFTQFCTFLIETFKDDSLKSYKIQIEMAMSVNPLIVRSMFSKYIAVHREEIEACDEHFLLQKIGENNGKYFVDFNTIWSRSENTVLVKAKIFQYFKKMIKLC
jgi:hypothetical protein